MYLALTKCLHTPTRHPSDVVEAARAYLGVPFRHEGRTRAGLDCAGLVLRVGWDLGLIEGDVSGYPADPDGVTLQRICELVARPIQPKGAAGRAPMLCLGAVALFAFTRHATHLGIISPGRPWGVIHAYSRGKAEVVEHRLDASWLRRLVRAYEFPGVWS